MNNQGIKRFWDDYYKETSRDTVKHILIITRDYIWLPFWSIIWLPIFIISYFLIFAPLGNLISLFRLKNGKKPRIVWGCWASPCLGYQIKADIKAGYNSQSIIWYPAYFNQNWEVGWLWSKIIYIGRYFVLPRYIVFLWSLLRYDIFQYYFNQHQLSDTIIEYFELKLLKIAGKRIMLSIYGSDAFIRGMKALDGQDLIDILKLDYPRILEVEDKVKTNLKIGSKYADYIYGCPPHIDIMPRVDYVKNPICIDVTEWENIKANNNKIVKIAHLSNHRNIKGTKYIIDTCDQLNSTSFVVELDVIEKASREEAKRRLSEADIFVDQLIIGVYGMAAVEAMALGKPVISYLREDISSFDGFKEWKGCPIVVADPNTIYDQLLKLITNPSLRKELGIKGRNYVEKRHSIDAISKSNSDNYKMIWV